MQAGQGEMKHNCWCKAFLQKRLNRKLYLVINNRQIYIKTYIYIFTNINSNLKVDQNPQLYTKGIQNITYKLIYTKQIHGKHKI